MKKKQISSFQASVLLYTSIVPTAIVSIPSVVMSHAKQDAWVSTIGATLAGVGLALLIGTIVKNNPGLSIQDWVRQRLGQTAGFVFSLLLAFYYLAAAPIILQEFTGIMTSQILPNTPPTVVLILILLVCGYAVLSGIEVIARANVIVTVVSLFPYFFSLFMFSRLLHFENLLPVLQQRWGAIAYGGLLPAGWFSELALLLILSPYLNNRAQAGKIAVGAIVVSGLHLTVTVMLAIFVFGPTLPQQFRYPSFSMIEVLRIGTVLERIDILFAAFWICTIYIKASVFLFAAYQCLLEAFQLRPTRPVMAVLLLLVFLEAMTGFQDEVQFSQYNKLVTPYVLLVFNVVLPLLLAIGLLIRKQGPKEEESVTCGSHAQG